jgi:hypothetical protein
MFELINSETKPLTRELAERFKAMSPSPTERAFDPTRARMLREKAEAGQFINCNWAIAKLGDIEYRMNGQHSSSVATEVDEQLLQGRNVHIDTYKVDDTDALALLFRQFDNRKSGRTPTDVSGAYQGLYPELRDISRDAAKFAVEGAAWYEKKVEGLPAPSGDDVYTLFGKKSLHKFIRWIGEVFSVKTPELRRQTIVAAMYGTFDKNEAEARRFWTDVSRGGVQYEDNHPTTVLDTFLKSVIEEKKKWDLKSANLYQASVYAWNAYRENKTITSVKYDTKKGLYTVAA